MKNAVNKRTGISTEYISIRIITILMLVSFFAVCLMVYGTPLYNDSDQYIKMHVHREPLYPLFLLLMRILAGDSALTLAGIVQVILIILAAYRFIIYVMDEIVKDNASNRYVMTVVLTLIVLTPYIITPLMSATHVMMATGILSEALVLPFLLLYVVELHIMLSRYSIKSILLSLLFADLMALTRSQMLVAVLAWTLLLMLSSFIHKKYFGVFFAIVALVASLLLRNAFVKTYNYVFNGRYVDNVYTNLTFLSNIFYVTDRVQGELIDDEDTRNVFYRLYDVMDGNEWSYRYSNDSIIERTIYLEEMHDRIKFDVLEAGFRDIMNERGMPDYIDYNLEAERYSKDMIRVLWPGCFGRWLTDFLLLGCRGVVRSIAVCRPIAYIYVLLMILYAIYGIMSLIRANGDRDAAYFMIIALIMLIGNAFGTAVTIMCLSRYMVYSFSLFYSAVVVNTSVLINRKRGIIKAR